MPNKIKHLEMIEKIIERMAKNCLQIKGWTITLVTLVSAFAAKDNDKRFLLLSLIPILGFWLLDAFYVQVERRYKILYARVAKMDESEIDFNMNTRIISCSNEEKKRTHYLRCLVSDSETAFYCLIIATIVFLFFSVF